ncbi:unnamed protein product, partial [Penicillium discolor]
SPRRARLRRPGLRRVRHRRVRAGRPRRAPRAAPRGAARRVPGHLRDPDALPRGAVPRHGRHGRRRSAPVDLRLARGQRRQPVCVPPVFLECRRRAHLQPHDELAQRSEDPRRRQPGARASAAPRTRCAAAGAAAGRGGGHGRRALPLHRRRRGRRGRGLVRRAPRRPRGDLGLPAHRRHPVPVQAPHADLRRRARRAGHPAPHPRPGRPARHARGRRCGLDAAGGARSDGGLGADPAPHRPALRRRGGGHGGALRAGARTRGARHRPHAPARGGQGAAPLLPRCRRGRLHRGRGRHRARGPGRLSPAGGDHAGGTRPDPRGRGDAGASASRVVPAHPGAHPAHRAGTAAGHRARRQRDPRPRARRGHPAAGVRRRGARVPRRRRARHDRQSARLARQGREHRRAHAASGAAGTRRRATAHDPRVEGLGVGRGRGRAPRRRRAAGTRVRHLRLVRLRRRSLRAARRPGCAPAL